MGVYIKGMEMPTSCEKCPFLDYEEGFCFASAVKGKSGWYESKLRPCEIKGGRPDECPLVHIPPHGRLIDADMMEKEVCGGCVHGEHKYANCIDCALANAPTIIEAEEGE